MTRMRWLLGVFLVFFCMATPVQGVYAEFTLHADGVSKEDGNSRGALVAFFQEHTLPEQAKTQAAFRVEAKRLHIEVDYADPAIRAEDANSAYYVPNAQREPDRDLTDAVVVGIENRADYRWRVVSAADAAVEVVSRCTEFLVPQEERLTRLGLVFNSGRTTEVDLSRAVRIESCSQHAEVVVSGSFCLSLWEWDVEVSSADGSEVITTGSTPSDYAAGATGDYARKMREAFLCAGDATLTAPIGAGPYDLYVQDARIEGATSVNLAGAVGEVHVGGQLLRLAGEDADFTGSNLGVALTRSGGEKLRAAVTGDVERLDVSGTQVLKTPASESTPWMWFWVAAVAIVLAVAAVRLRPYHYANRFSRKAGISLAGEARPLRRSVGLLILAELAAQSHRPRSALRRVTKALQIDATSTEAHRLRARLLTGLGRYEEAVHEHDALDPLIGNASDRAANAREAARTLCALGRVEEAVRRLDCAVGWDAAMVYPFLDHADFTALRSHPWLRLQRVNRDWHMYQ